MPTFYVDLQIGIPKESSMIDSSQKLEEVIGSNITQMIAQLFPQYANVECDLILNFSLGLVDTNIPATVVEGNNTLQ